MKQSNQHDIGACSNAIAYEMDFDHASDFRSKDPFSKLILALSVKSELQKPVSDCPEKKRPTLDTLAAPVYTVVKRLVSSHDIPFSRNRMYKPNAAVVASTTRRQCFYMPLPSM